MRQQFLAVWFSCNALVSFGQDRLFDILPLIDNRVAYSEVIQVEGASSSELYSRVIKWFVLTYKSSKDVIQLDDKVNGEIIGKGTFKISYYARNPSIGHTVIIAVKDGRYKYTIKDLNYSDSQGDSFMIEDFPNTWAGKKKLYTAVDEEIKAVIASLKRAMITSKNEDW